MNLLLVSEDGRLAALVDQTCCGSNTLVVAQDAEEASRLSTDYPFDVVILSDRVAGAGNLLPGWPGAHKIYLLSNRHHAGRQVDALKEAMLEGWDVIPPGLTSALIAERIGRLIFGEPAASQSGSKNGIIQFVGTTPNIGVTIASFGTAKYLASLSGKKVAYLCLNLKSSKIHTYLGDREPTVSLDTLRAELRSGSLTGERLLKLGHPQKEAPGLTVFYGNLQREQADYYTIEEMECLLKKASETFDYCIVETSAYWDNAGTIGAMRLAGQRLLVTTQRLSHFQEDWQRWFGTLSAVLELKATDFDLVVTQTDLDALYRTKDIARETGMTRIGELRKDRNIDLLLAEGRMMDGLTEDAPLGMDCRKLACTLLAVRGESYKANKRMLRQTAGWLNRNPFRWLGRRVEFVRK